MICLNKIQFANQRIHTTSCINPGRNIDSESQILTVGTQKRPASRERRRVLRQTDFPVFSLRLTPYGYMLHIYVTQKYGRRGGWRGGSLTFITRSSNSALPLHRKAAPQHRCPTQGSSVTVRPGASGTPRWSASAAHLSVSL
jgi:hypothetical protein